MTTKIWFMTICILIVVSSANAEMYKWIAEDGSVTFKDTPPPASKKNKKVKVYKDGDFAPAPPAQPVPSTRKSKQTVASASQPEPVKRQRFNGTVEIYVTDWCGYCKQAIAYMTNKGIPFTAFNIEKDTAANQRYKDLGGHGVPLIIIGANKMSGFSPEFLEYYLNNVKSP